MCELPVYMQSSPSREALRLPPGSQVNSERPSYAAVSPHLGVCVYLCLCMVMVCSLALTPSTTTTARPLSERGKTDFFFFPSTSPPPPLAFTAVLVGLVFVCSYKSACQVWFYKKKKKILFKFIAGGRCLTREVGVSR